MENLSGQSIGHYHIVEQLGEGGMGVVYKAYDTHLECDVAIKFLHTGLMASSDEERAQKRFLREAQSTAKLIHPNIVKVLDYGEYQGIRYLVMPYYPGGTLRQKQGYTIPFKEAARLLIPIGRALQYAHKMDVVHRDVKPSNILFTETGEPMLTDFGVAKIMSSSEGHTLTGTGVGVGTPPYMAPEQGLGKDIDGRADIYALGVVFFELVTGRLPYEANTPIAILMQTLNDPLPRPSSLNKDLPKKVEEVIYKALAKTPADRYQRMSDFVDALENLRMIEPSRKEDEKTIDSEIPTINGVSRSHRKNAFGFFKKHPIILVIAILAIAGISLLVVGFLSGRKNEEKVILVPTLEPTIHNQVIQNSMESPTVIVKDTATPTITLRPTQTPNGGGNGRIVYVANNDIYVMNADGSDQKQITKNGVIDQAPSWAPDGTKITFASNADLNFEIYKMEANGDRQQRLTDNKDNDNDPVWSPDGMQIAFWSSNGNLKFIWVMNTDGTGLKRITENGAYEPAWSPDGTLIAYSQTRDSAKEIYVMKSNGKNALRLAKNVSFDSKPVWSPDGTKVAYTSNVDGNLEIYTVNVDGSDPTNITKNSASDNEAAWSPNGKMVAFTSGRDGNNEIYIMTADGGNPTRLTENISDDWKPSWSPDGNQIVFISNRDGKADIYGMNADGSRQARLTNTGATDPAWGPDTLNVIAALNGSEVIKSSTLVSPTETKKATNAIQPTATTSALLSPGAILTNYLVDPHLSKPIDFTRFLDSLPDINVSPNSVELLGKTSWATGVSLEKKINDGDGIVVDFLVDPSSHSEIFIDNGKFDTSSYKRFGIYPLSPYDQPATNYWIGNNFSMDPLGIKIQPSTWYSLFLGVGLNGDFKALIWEKNNPKNLYLFEKKPGKEWAGKDWGFRSTADSGKLTIANLLTVGFSSFK